MENIDVNFARRIIKICSVETKKIRLTKQTKLSKIGVDSITFVKILFAIEESEGINFEDNFPLLSDCETIYDLIKQIQIYKSESTRKE